MMNKSGGDKLRTWLVGMSALSAVGVLSQPASAVVPLPTSGICAFTATLNYPFAYLYGSSPGSGYGVNWIATIDFANKLISVNVVLQNPGSASGTTESQSTINNIPFVVSSGPIAGTYTLSFSAPDSGDTLHFNVIPVGDGNEVLLQAIDLTAGDQGSSIVGDCQMQYFNSSGDNVHIGYQALSSTTTGTQNTATGVSALLSDTTGSGNAAVGYQALLANSTGANNTAFGANALAANTTGKGNAAQGVNALLGNTTGIRNLGVGNNALSGNTTGSYNIGLGYEGGYYVTTGSNNIEIGSPGTASDNNTIQIGVQGTQTSTTIAGIYGTTLTGSAVYVTAAGKLGVLASSERFKTDVASMGDASAKLADLRPVTFKLKNDAQGAVQYGLIAEEVAKVYPELVIRGADGRIDGVRYEELTPMLLNQMQQERQEMNAAVDAQRAVARTLSDRSAQQAAEIADLKRQISDMRAGLTQLQAKSPIAATP